MPGYKDLAAQNTQLPSLADMAAILRAKKAQKAQAAGRNPGDRPADAQGAPLSVSIPGERPVQAQPVSGGPQVTGVQVGTPQMPPQYQMTVGQPQMPPQMTVGQPYNQRMTTAPVALQVDPRAQKVKQLMAQGATYEQAMRAVQGG